MTARGLRSLVAGSVAAALMSAPALRAGDTQQRETREHDVIVSVVGSNNTPVTGLTAAEFTVREDNVAREVLRVGAAPPPSHVALLVDDSQVSKDAVQFLRTSLASFVKRVMSGEQAPQIGLWTFGERPTRRADFSPNSAQVDKAIDRIFALQGSGSYLMEAVQEVAKDFKKKKAERPVIVAFVDESGPEFSNLTHKQVADALRDAGASLWTITNQARTQSMGSTEARERAQVLGDVTVWSGGVNTAVLTPQALDTTFGSVADQILKRYKVTYGRPDTLVPPDKIEVQVKKADTKVRVTRWAGR